MTLKPIFRSEEAKRLLDSKYGFFMEKPLEIQLETRKKINERVEIEYNKRFRGKPLSLNPEKVAREDFFLVFFNSALMHKCKFVQDYSDINYFIRGIVIGGDNIIDKQYGSSIPLEQRRTPIGQGVTQIRICDRYLTEKIHEIAPNKKKRREITETLENKLLTIWDSAENAAFDQRICEEKELIRKVHSFVGGELFSLGFVAPKILEPEHKSFLDIAEKAFYDIGTGFQITDDIADLSEDLGTLSANLIISRAYHYGTEEEQRVLNMFIKEAREAGRNPKTFANRNLLRKYFRVSALKVLDYAHDFVRKGFESLNAAGLTYLDPKDTEVFVRAIAGDIGEKNISQLTR